MSIEFTTAAPYDLRPGAALEEQEALGVRMRWLARARETAGALTLIEYEAPPRFAGPGLHRHEGQDEFFLVLGGTLELQVGDQRHSLDEGGFAWGPRAVPHTFANHAETPARFLFGLSPAGLEEMFRELMGYVAETGPAMDPNELNAINERHGVAVVGPPLPMP